MDAVHRLNGSGYVPDNTLDDGALQYRPVEELV